MTGYTVHTGSNDNFREGYDQVFKSRKSRKAKTTRKKSTANKATGNKARQGKK